MLRHLDLFSGIGGFALAAHWTGGIKTTQSVEIDPYCQQILSKNFPETPIHGDITTFTAQPNSWDIATVSFPCQDLSEANSQGKGLDGERSGLWFEAHRIVQEALPTYVVIENVPSTTQRNWLRTVLEGLDALGYDAEWSLISAKDLGARHLRRRHWVIAYPSSLRFEEADSEAQKFSENALEQAEARRQENGEHTITMGGRARRIPIARTLRSADGIPTGLDKSRVKALGNAVVPQVAMIPLLRVLHIQSWTKQRC